VADYTALVAAGLADAGCDVHAWAPGDAAGPEPVRPGVTAHRVAGRFGPRGLLRLGRGLSAFPGPRTVLVQYTPHMYGAKGMNLPFCLWVLARRVAHGDDVRVMFHEVSMPFVRRPVHWNLIAAANRAMAAVLVAAARRVDVAIPAWERLLRGLGGRRRPVAWLPVPANVPAGPAPAAAADPVVGHFGTHSPLVTPLFVPAARQLLADRPDVRFLLIGRGGDRFRDDLTRDRPDWAARVTATGGLPPAEVSARLRACALVLQPYPDGVSTRRGSVMAALANGVPVVTTFGDLSEPVWKDEPGVALADPGELAGAAARLLDDPARRAALGRAGRDLYERRFALRHTIAALLAG
jgi:glycosyltransferase involved in cell wall biosynthesis